MQKTNIKVDRLEYIKIKNFSASKDTINRMKIQPIEWKKIFANHISDKGLIHRIYKKLLQLKNNNNKK